MRKHGVLAGLDGGDKLVGLARHRRQHAVAFASPSEDASSALGHLAPANTLVSYTAVHSMS